MIGNSSAEGSLEIDGAFKSRSNGVLIRCRATASGRPWWPGTTSCHTAANYVHFNCSWFDSWIKMSVIGTREQSLVPSVGRQSHKAILRFHSCRMENASKFKTIALPPLPVEEDTFPLADCMRPLPWRLITSKRNWGASLPANSRSKPVILFSYLSLTQSRTKRFGAYKETIPPSSSQTSGRIHILNCCVGNSWRNLSRHWFHKDIVRS